QAKAFELPPGATDGIDRGRQTEGMVGDRRADRFAGRGPDETIAAQPGIQRRGIVMPAVAPQHHVAARALRRLRGGGGAPRRYGYPEQWYQQKNPAHHSSTTASTALPAKAGIHRSAGVTGL